jgi:hypothetical protein
MKKIILAILVCSNAMAGQVVVCTRPDGGVSVLSPAGGMGASAVLQKDVRPDCLNPKIVERSSLPDREYRNAWKQSGAAVVVDVERAKDLQKEKILNASAVAIEKLDKQIQKAELSGKSAEEQSLSAKKNSLKNKIKAIDTSRAKDINELGAMWPSELPKE